MIIKQLVLNRGTVITLILLTVFAIHACRKDHLFQVDPQKSELIQGASPEIIKWYETLVPGGDMEISGLGGSSAVTVFSEPKKIVIRPDWNKATTCYSGDSTVSQVAYDSKAKSATSKSDIDPKSFNFSQSNSYTELLFIQTKRKTRGVFMTILGDEDYLKEDKAKLHKNTYFKKEKDFSGEVLYFTLKGKFINGYRFTNGQITGKVRDGIAVDKNTAASKDFRVKLEQECQMVQRVTFWEQCTDYYNSYTFEYQYTTCNHWTETSYYEICNTSPGGGGGSVPGDPCEDGDHVNVANPDGDDPDGPAGPGGTGGGECPEGAPMPYLTIKRDTSITKNAKANCILDKLEGHNTKFDSLTNAFISKNHNLTFILDDLPVRSDGTRANGATTHAGRNFTTTLDRTFVRDHTQIEIAKTFLHEVFHANLSQHAYQVFGSVAISQWPKRPEDMTLTELMDKIDASVAGSHQLEATEHEYMANHIDVLAKGLKEILVKYGNPGEFSDEDYIAMAYSGLENTKFYEQITEGNFGELSGTLYTLRENYRLRRITMRSFSTLNCN